MNHKIKQAPTNEYLKPVINLPYPIIVSLGMRDFPFSSKQMNPLSTKPLDLPWGIYSAVTATIVFLPVLPQPLPSKAPSPHCANTYEHTWVLERRLFTFFKHYFSLPPHHESNNDPSVLLNVSRRCMYTYQIGENNKQRNAKAHESDLANVEIHSIKIWQTLEKEPVGSRGQSPNTNLCILLERRSLF